MFLSLTPVLWAPENWRYFWNSIYALSMGLPPRFDGSFGSPTGRCKTFHDKQTAVSGPATDVSGWYGPGAYLAWLLTAYAASLTSIWRSKSSPSTERMDIIEGELLAAFLYPLIAILDMLYRFIRCRVDPSSNAAIFLSPPAPQSLVRLDDCHGKLMASNRHAPTCLRVRENGYGHLLTSSAILCSSPLLVNPTTTQLCSLQCTPLPRSACSVQRSEPRVAWIDIHTGNGGIVHEEKDCRFCSYPNRQSRRVALDLGVYFSGYWRKTLGHGPAGRILHHHLHDGIFKGKVIA